MAGITAGYKKTEMESDGGVQYNIASNMLLAQHCYQLCGIKAQRWLHRNGGAFTQAMEQE